MGLLGTIGLLALIALGGWVLGPLALRLGGGLLFLNALISLVTGTSWLWSVVLGFLAIGAGEALADFKHGTGRSPIARRASAETRERCRMCNKDVFATEDNAWEAVRRSQHGFQRGQAGEFDAPLDHAYYESGCGNWHVSSQPQRR